MTTILSVVMALALGNHSDAIENIALIESDAEASGRWSHCEADSDRGGDCAASWLPTLGGAKGANDFIFALLPADQGSPCEAKLYAGGRFTIAGGVEAGRVAAWNGESWETAGSGVNGDVNALVMFNDGSRADALLYAGGSFTTADGKDVNYIARWDGVAWSPVGAGFNGSVFALAVHDDGTGDGPALYAGGAFTESDETEMLHIARWDGESWTPVGTGVNNAVFALLSIEGVPGGKSELIVGGDFIQAGGASALRVARWSDGAWSSMGSGFTGGVRTLAATRSGSEKNVSVFAGGFFTFSGVQQVNRVARWDGAAWSALGEGISGSFVGVRTLAVLEDVSSPDGVILYAGGTFSRPFFHSNRVTMWNGTDWTPLGHGVNDFVSALALFDSGCGAGRQLFAAGGFGHANQEISNVGGSRVNHIAQWSGDSWRPLGRSPDSWILAMTPWRGGPESPDSLFVGGSFVEIGDIEARSVANWNGHTLTSLGSSPNGTVFSLLAHDDGSGEGVELYAGGFFAFVGGVMMNNIAKWNGAEWSALGSGLGGIVRALHLYDEGANKGSLLYATGQFTGSGGTQALRIAKWNGTAWAAVGTGLAGGSSPLGRALAVFDDGTVHGTSLFVGGRFESAGGVPALNIARWNGVSWSAVGDGLNGSVHALAVFDDGAGGGPALYAAGGFTASAETKLEYIARWNGATWESIGEGADAPVYALTSLDASGNSEPALIAGGAGGLVIRWDGNSWTSLGLLANGDVFALGSLQDGAGPDPTLYVGGSFVISEAGDSYLTRWHPCPRTATIPADLNGDGIVNAQDLAILLSLWGICPAFPNPCAGDFNDDGVVNAQDLAYLLSYWNYTSHSPK